VCEQYPTWLDNRFVYAQVGGLWAHPLLDPSRMNLLGNIRGTLVWDAVKRMLHVERPEPAQAWTSPLADAQDGSLRIYANGEAFRQRRHDRVLSIPDCVLRFVIMKRWCPSSSAAAPHDGAG
jgi:hypothetical protein